MKAADVGLGSILSKYPGRKERRFQPPRTP
jgi:hypothetical protein